MRVLVILLGKSIWIVSLVWGRFRMYGGMESCWVIVMVLKLIAVLGL